MSRRIAALTVALALLLCGCSSVLERSYNTEVNHAASHYIKGDPNILSASNYQELINTILILLESHAESGIIRIPITDGSAASMARDACDEVQNDTALGAYLLKYITCTGSLDPRYYELHLSFTYRRSKEQQHALIHASSVQALPELIETAKGKSNKQIAFVFNNPTDVASFTAMAESVREDWGEDQPWGYAFYPNDTEPLIAEILFDK